VLCSREFLAEFQKYTPEIQHIRPTILDHGLGLAFELRLWMRCLVLKLTNISAFAEDDTLQTVK